MLGGGAGEGGHRKVYFKAHRWVRVSVWRASELKNLDFIFQNWGVFKNPWNEVTMWDRLKPGEIGVLGSCQEVGGREIFTSPKS